MATTMENIFVNLPVKDLKKTMEFFGKIGFEFNPQFTDDNATCMIIGPNIYAMLLTENYFQTFISKPVADAAKSTEVIVALSATSREEVDEIVDNAMAAGAGFNKEPQDHGFMYSRSFQDLDGHVWEVFFMNMNAVNPNEQ